MILNLEVSCKFAPDHDYLNAGEDLEEAKEGFGLPPNYMKEHDCSAAILMDICPDLVCDDALKGPQEKSRLPSSDLGMQAGSSSRDSHSPDASDIEAGLRTPSGSESEIPRQLDPSDSAKSRHGAFLHKLGKNSPWSRGQESLRKISFKLGKVFLWPIKHFPVCCYLSKSNRSLKGLVIYCLTCMYASQVVLTTFAWYHFEQFMQISWYCRLSTFSIQRWALRSVQYPGLSIGDLLIAS